MVEEGGCNGGGGGRDCSGGGAGGETCMRGEGDRVEERVILK